MTHEEQIKKSVNDKVDSFKDSKSITLEISRIIYYLAELNSKQWHIINEEATQNDVPENQEQKAKKHPSSELEAVSDSKN